MIRTDGKDFSPTRAIKLSRIATIITADVQREATFTDTRQSLLTYAPTLEEVFGACFVNMEVADIVDDRIYSDFLASNAMATYMRYIREAKMKIKRKGMLPVLRDLPKKHQQRRIQA